MKDGCERGAGVECVLSYVDGVRGRRGGSTRALRSKVGGRFLGNPIDCGCLSFFLRAVVAGASASGCSSDFSESAGNDSGSGASAPGEETASAATEALTTVGQRCTVRGNPAVTTGCNAGEYCR